MAENDSSRFPEDDSWRKTTPHGGNDPASLKLRRTSPVLLKATRDKPGFAGRCLLKVAGFLFFCLLISSFLLTFSVENLESLLLNLFAEKTR